MSTMQRSVSYHNSKCYINALTLGHLRSGRSKRTRKYTAVSTLEYCCVPVSSVLAQEYNKHRDQEITMLKGADYVYLAIRVY